jgi:ribosomal protein S27E
MSEPRAPEPDDAVTCALCGATEPSLPLGWSTALERGRRVVHCESCSRENVRSMESKLDPEWW